ncbi:hypothetical protein HK096_005308, partial [Nowakowskiella sp. JEL0078]
MAVSPPQYLLWDALVERDATKSSCSQFPLSTYQKCSSFSIPPPDFNSSLPNTNFYGSFNCSTYEYSSPQSYTLQNSSYFFPPNADGEYLLYSDTLTRTIQDLQDISSENNNTLGKMCIPRPFRNQILNMTSAITDPSSTSPSSAVTSSPSPRKSNRFYIQGFLADGKCNSLTNSGNSTGYWKATCSDLSLLYGCTDDQCTQNCSKPLNFNNTSCGIVCVKASEYRNTPIFGWGSPLLNGLPKLKYSITNTKPDSSESSLYIVAISVGGSVLILAVTVIIASFLISKQLRQRKSRTRPRSNSGISSDRSGSTTVNTDSQVSSKTVTKARRQYKNAAKEAKKQHQQQKNVKQNQIHRLNTQANILSKNNLRNNNDSDSVTPNSIMELTKVGQSPKISDIAALEFAFHSESDLEHSPIQRSILGSYSDSNKDLESNASSIFYQNAFAAASHAAQTASLAAALAASAATSAANIMAMTERRQKAKSDFEMKSIELDNIGSSDLSNVIVTSSDYVVPDFANPVFGTPESQYGILGNTSPNDFFLNTNSPSFQSMLASIPPMVLSSETTSKTTKLPDGTETTTTISRSLNTFGGTYDQRIGRSLSRKLLETGQNLENSKGQRAISVAAHFAEQSTEIDLIVGDVVRLVSVGPVWSVGVNLRSG